MSNPIPVRNEWHQQPAIWVVLGVLAFTVVSSFVLLFLALRNPPQMVVEDYTAIAEISANEFEQDRRARDLALKATVEFSAAPNDSYEANTRIVSASNMSMPQRLRLRIKHSTLAAMDRDILLTRFGDAYTGRVNLPNSPFDLFIEDEGGTWRLAGRLSGPVARLELEAIGQVATQ